MNLIAILPVRNEDWVLGFSLRVALLWCDMVVALNHASTDGSQQILEDVSRETGGRIVLATNLDPAWPEMVHRQQLLNIARNYGASHIALIDADEVLTGDSLPLVRAAIEKLPPARSLSVRMYCMWRGLHQYRSDPGSVWSNRRDLALAFHDSPKCEFAAQSDGYQHHARAPRNSAAIHDISGIGVMHLQFADWKRLTAKHALYKVRERLQYPHRPVSQIESMYNLALDESGIQVSATPPGWLGPYRNLTKYLHFNQEPWQAEEVKRLIREHGPQPFDALDLFGVGDPK